MPTHYFDLRAVSFEGVSEQQALSTAVSLLHRGAKEGGFAIAFPLMTQGDQPSLGGILRVFASSNVVAEDFRRLLRRLEAGGYGVLGGVNPVPAYVAHEAYVRIRVPTASRGQSVNRNGVARSADRVAKEVVGRDTARLRQAALARAAAAPFIDVVSQNNGQSFRIHIERIAADAGGVGALNGYGLSGRDKPFALPVIA